MALDRILDLLRASDPDGVAEIRVLQTAPTGDRVHTDLRLD